MSTEPSVELDRAVAAVANAITADSEGSFSIPPERFLELSRAFAEPMAKEKRLELATHLLALALKYERIEKERTAKAVGQITVLLGLVTQADSAGSAPASSGGTVREKAARAIARAQGLRAKVLARGKSSPAGKKASRPSGGWKSRGSR